MRSGALANESLEDENTATMSAHDLATKKDASPLREASNDHRLTFGATLLVAVFSGGLLLTNLGHTRALTHHEVMFAQPAKEMLATGNWILPKFAGVPCTHKPPGTNWVIAATMAITGSQAEWVVRFPSAVAGVIAALLVAAMAARWFGTLTGVVAGLMQVSTFYVLQLGRLAECDIFLIASTTGALFTFAVANLDSPRGRSNARWLPWLFYFCVTLSFLFKGLVGPVFILGACGLYLLVAREGRILKFLFSPLGITLFLGVTIGWIALAYGQHPAIVHDQIVHHFGRLQGELQGKKNPFFYIYSIPLILLPWTPFCVVGMVWAARSHRFPTAIWRLAICWLIPGLILLSVSAFKSKHYPAPLMPPLTIIGAVMMIRYFTWRQSVSWRWHLGAVAACVVGFSAGVIAIFKTQPEGYVLTAGLIGMLAGAVLLMIYFEYRGRLRAELITVFAATWVIGTGSLFLVANHHDSYRDATTFAERANNLVPGDAPLYVVDLVENQITYYLKSPVVRIDQVDDFDSTQIGGGPWYVLAPESLKRELAAAGRVYALDRCDSIRRYNESDERLTLFRVDRELTVDARAMRIFR